jgi:Mlc titration factor MtfA (ptsG expression regulator)
MLGILRALRRRRLRREPFPEGWLAILARRVPFFRTLASPFRERFLERLRFFVAEKRFLGAAEMEITEEVKVVIAAAAVRLTLHHPDLDAYDRLSEIVVYPHVYRHGEGDGAVFGEAHDWGTVVLAWPAVLQGLANAGDGHDTASHEFAHVLDRADGGFDGTPVLERLELYHPWAHVMSDHFQRLRRRGRPQRKALRDYGALNEAEFFAVATESYFEKPHQLKAETPDLYQLLQDYYGGDPAADAQKATTAEEPRKLGRNSPCPCGSGRKYKRCCGRR